VFTRDDGRIGQEVAVKTRAALPDSEKNVPAALIVIRTIVPGEVEACHRLARQMLWHALKSFYPPS
jgi:hypothetical protein